MTQLEKHLEKLQNTDNFWAIDYHPGSSFSPFSLLTDSRWKMKLTNYCEKTYMPLSTLQNWYGLYCFWLRRDGRKTPLYGGKSSGNLAERIRAGYFNKNFSYYCGNKSWCEEDQVFVSFSRGSTTHEKDMIKTLAPIFNKQHNPFNETYFSNVQTFEIIKAEIEEARIKMYG